ncbi:MAG: class I SAM-dependent methyltransferase [Gaiellaceae bacterium]|jgi:ubiquinone/menaquinone biosynthesis C-methylase UbiE
MGDTEIRHLLFSRLLGRFVGYQERHGGTEYRRELLNGARGCVLEIGPGEGPNFPHFPAAVTGVVAVEPEPHLRELARRAARAAPVPIEVVAGRVEELPFTEGEFDVVVVASVLCTVSDPVRALSEIRRVLKPGGELRFWEHVAAAGGFLRRHQRAIDLVWPLFTGGCHTCRDTEATIEQAGFRIERCRRFKFQPSLLVHVISPQILGVARAPEPGA